MGDQSGGAEPRGPEPRGPGRGAELATEEGSGNGGVQPEGGAQQEQDTLLGLLQRERADFRNYKRRLEDERRQDRETAKADVITRLLPVLDELDRALAYLPADLADHPWARGVAASRSTLRDALQALGIEKVGRPGEPFDPSQHDAVFYEPREDATERVVAEVVRPGYRLNGRILRPAQVTVVGPIEDDVAPIEEPAANVVRPDTEPRGG